MRNSPSLGAEKWNCKMATLCGFDSQWGLLKCVGILNVLATIIVRLNVEVL